MTPEEIADLHQRATPAQSSWTPEALRAQLERPETLIITGSHAFALGRLVAAEAELLLIATDPDHQRHGHGSACLRDFEARAAERMATGIHLEVAASNHPARSLYGRHGYAEVGRRAGYYQQSGDGPDDAILMHLGLGDA